MDIVGKSCYLYLKPFEWRCQLIDGHFILLSLGYIVTLIDSDRLDNNYSGSVFVYDEFSR